MEANIYFKSVTIQPNPVDAGRPYILSVEIAERIPVIGGDDFRLTDMDGAMIEAPQEGYREF